LDQGRSIALEIAVDGGSVQVEIAGAGTPIVLLHGWSLDRRIWQPQIEALSSRFRLIAIDRRGFGRSSAPPGLASEIDDLLVVRRTLALDRMVLVGMSQAGRIALRFALAHPHLVCGLVLQGAPLDGFQPGPRREEGIPLTSYMALVREGRIERMKELWRDHMLMRSDVPGVRSRLDELLADYEGRDLLSAEPDGLAPIASELEDVYAPSLVVTGEHDTPWRQLVGDALAYGLPHSSRVKVPGAGHLCNVEHPEAFNALLAGFVTRIENKPQPPA
jgi:pimeloyl-ACP methyl ester carboxylesterase